jgi:hypothetical protein
MKCKISNWGCLYHACLSDDCQKRFVLENGVNYGKGKCEKKMTKDERNKALKAGKIIIRAQLTRWGWRVVRMTDQGGWTPLTDAKFPDRETAEKVCDDIEIQHPEKYCDDND